MYKRQVQREGIDQAVHIPGGLAVFFKELAHQHFLGADVGLAADDGDVYKRQNRAAPVRFSYGYSGKIRVGAISSPVKPFCCMAA